MINVWGMTDVGLVRKENQDAYAVKRGSTTDHVICVVCDGMGGPAGGCLASHIAVNTFVEELEKVLNAGMTLEQLREVSSRAVAVANKAIRAEAAKSEEYCDMGTTLVSAVSCGEDVVICNVGDSRAYHITQDGIARITRDHSLVERMVERGDITAEEARRHPSRNLITRALGPDVIAECDDYVCPLKSGEYLLLCTDGLIDTVTDQEMLFEVIHGDNVATCLNRLLDISKSRGASDNVTAVLLQKL